MLKKFILLFPLFFFLATPLQAQEPDTQNSQERSFEAEIDQADQIPCGQGDEFCLRLSLSTLTASGETVPISITIEPSDALGGKLPDYKKGDNVIVQTEFIDGEARYFISDSVRRPSLFFLVILFIAAIVLLGGRSALRAFAGLLVSIIILFFVLIPAILAGWPPLLTAILASIILMVLTFLLSHGWNAKTVAALGGTTGSLILTGLLAMTFSYLSNLTGTADEEMLFLLSSHPELNARGILLAAIIIGTLGVLDDITIAQSSAVMELRKANRAMHWRDLYRSAFRIGSDHIAAAVNTLILAYAGTALPLLLLLAAEPAGESWWTFINREMIATEIVRTLVGSIGLLAAVPLTTYIASKLALKSEAVRSPSPSIHSH